MRFSNSHLHQFIGWTGSRPSEALELLWKDIDFDRGNYIKRDTKSGKTLIQPMNEKVYEVLGLLRESSPFVSLYNNIEAVFKNSHRTYNRGQGAVRVHP